jgi:hypothetical protein
VVDVVGARSRHADRARADRARCCHRRPQGWDRPGQSRARDQCSVVLVRDRSVRRRGCATGCVGHRARQLTVAGWLCLGAGSVTGTACLGEHVTSAVRGSTLVDVALQDVPSVVRAAVAQIPRASVSELDHDGATLTQRSGVVIPRVEVISLAFRWTPQGDSEVVIVRARRGGLPAPDPVLSEFEQTLLRSIRAAAR